MSINSNDDKPVLFEVAWEVANRMGGIHTVLKTKSAVTGAEYGDRYTLMGPLVMHKAALEVDFDESGCLDAVCNVHSRNALATLKKHGVHVRTGQWLVPGRPHVILFDLGSVAWRLNGWRHDLQSEAGISSPAEDTEMNDVILLGYVIAWFLEEWQRSFDHHKSSSANDGFALEEVNSNGLLSDVLVVHYHEWMGGLAAVLCKARKWQNIASIFTTHATLLGRYLCASSEEADFYNTMEHVDPDREASRRGIYHRYRVERAAAHCATVFTTVSHITAFEAEHLLGRRPDGVLPNGLNIARTIGGSQGALLKRRSKAGGSPLTSLATQSSTTSSTLSGSLQRSGVGSRQQSKDAIRDFVTGHFYGHCDFDMQETLFYFTAGRYEYRNKGVDLLLESLARLNCRLKEEESNKTVVMFIIMPAATSSYNMEALKGQALTRRLKEAVGSLSAIVGERLYDATVRGSLPKSLSELIGEEDLVPLQRHMLSMRREHAPFPPIVTHNMIDGNNDQILNELRRLRLFNAPSDRVKVVFHPAFLSTDNPILGMEYEEFVSGCHLGVFPSYYEPWGYTPAECAVAGIPSVTTNLSGFGCYISECVASPSDHGVYIVDRRLKSVEESVQQLTDMMHSFARLTRRQRVALRCRTERLGEQLLDWQRVGLEYVKARHLAVIRTHSNIQHQSVLTTDPRRSMSPDVTVGGLVTSTIANDETDGDSVVLDVEPFEDCLVTVKL